MTNRADAPVKCSADRACLRTPMRQSRLSSAGRSADDQSSSRSEQARHHQPQGDHAGAAATAHPIAQSVTESDRTSTTTVERHRPDLRAAAHATLRDVQPGALPGTNSFLIPESHCQPPSSPLLSRADTACAVSASPLVHCAIDWSILPDGADRRIPCRCGTRATMVAPAIDSERRT